MSSTAEPGAGLVLDVEDLSVTVGETTLVSDVRLRIGAGEVVTLIGPSGAGKSTIAMAVADALDPTHRRSGTVRVRATQVGYLPQDAALTLNPARRIGAALGELVCLHGDPPARPAARRTWRRDRVAALLAEAAFPVDPRHLNIFVRRHPHEFSGGQRTRLALAQVLATAPDLLVLDEPSAGLDPISRRQMAEIILRLRDQGRSVLLVTHDHQLATEVSTRIHHVADGRVSTDPVSCGRPVMPARTGPETAPETASDELYETALEVEDASVRHGRYVLIRSAGLRVRGGELVGVVGASGAGKSTLARMTAGLVPRRGGEVRVDGVPCPGLSRRSREQVAAVQYVWQECRDSFEDHLSILDQVARTAVNLRRLSTPDARDEALAELAALGLSEAESRRTPPQLSGGQLRRAALARALLARPRVLLCDELTTGLDPASAGLLLDHLDRVRRRSGCAVLVLSHDLRLLLPRLDRLLVVDDGEITDDLRLAAADDMTPVSPALRRLLDADGVSLVAPSPAPRAVS